MDEIDDYIKCVNSFYQKNIIDKLKQDLKKEMDPMKQANILKEIMKIRGVKTSDWRNKNFWRKKRRIN